MYTAKSRRVRLATDAMEIESILIHACLPVFIP